MHRERPSRVAGAVAWQNTVDGEGGAGLVLPDGCMDLVWLGGRVLVAGADTAARPAPRTAGRRVGLRLAPGHLPVALDVPAHAVVDELVPLTELTSLPTARDVVARAEEELAGGARGVEVLEELASELGVGAHDTGLADEVARLATAGLSVREVAARTGLGARQLHRRSLTAFGYGPKVLARVLRLQRALALGRSGTPAATSAARAGYADQQHMARELRTLTGTTWTALLRPPDAQSSAA